MEVRSRRAVPPPSSTLGSGGHYHDCLPPPHREPNSFQDSELSKTSGTAVIMEEPQTVSSLPSEATRRERGAHEEKRTHDPLRAPVTPVGDNRQIEEVRHQEPQQQQVKPKITKRPATCSSRFGTRLQDVVFAASNTSSASQSAVGAAPISSSTSSNTVLFLSNTPQFTTTETLREQLQRDRMNFAKKCAITTTTTTPTATDGEIVDENTSSPVVPPYHSRNSSTPAAAGGGGASHITPNAAHRLSSSSVVVGRPVSSSRPREMRVPGHLVADTPEVDELLRSMLQARGLTAESDCLWRRRTQENEEDEGAGRHLHRTTMRPQSAAPAFERDRVPSAAALRTTVSSSESSFLPPAATQEDRSVSADATTHPSSHTTIGGHRAAAAHILPSSLKLISRPSSAISLSANDMNRTLTVVSQTLHKSESITTTKKKGTARNGLSSKPSSLRRVASATGSRGGGGFFLTSGPISEESALRGDGNDEERELERSGDDDDDVALLASSQRWMAEQDGDGAALALSKQQKTKRGVIATRQKERDATWKRLWALPKHVEARLNPNIIRPPTAPSEAPGNEASHAHSAQGVTRDDPRRLSSLSITEKLRKLMENKDARMAFREVCAEMRVEQQTRAGGGRRRAGGGGGEKPSATTPDPPVVNHHQSHTDRPTTTMATRVAPLQFPPSPTSSPAFPSRTSADPLRGGPAGMQSPTVNLIAEDESGALQAYFQHTTALGRVVVAQHRVREAEAKRACVQYMATARAVESWEAAMDSTGGQLDRATVTIQRNGWLCAVVHAAFLANVSYHTQRALQRQHNSTSSSSSCPTTQTTGGAEEKNPSAPEPSRSASPPPVTAVAAATAGVNPKPLAVKKSNFLTRFVPPFRNCLDRVERRVMRRAGKIVWRWWTLWRGLFLARRRIAAANLIHNFLQSMQHLLRAPSHLRRYLHHIRRLQRWWRGVCSGRAARHELVLTQCVLGIQRLRSEAQEAIKTIRSRTEVQEVEIANRRGVPRLMKSDMIRELRRQCDMQVAVQRRVVEQCDVLVEPAMLSESTRQEEGRGGGGGRPLSASLRKPSASTPTTQQGAAAAVQPPPSLEDAVRDLLQKKRQEYKVQVGRYAKALTAHHHEVHKLKTVNRLVVVLPRKRCALPSRRTTARSEEDLPGSPVSPPPSLPSASQQPQSAAPTRRRPLFRVMPSNGLLYLYYSHRQTKNSSGEPAGGLALVNNSRTNTAGVASGAMMNRAVPNSVLSKQQQASGGGHAAAPAAFFHPLLTARHGSLSARRMSMSLHQTTAAGTPGRGGGGSSEASGGGGGETARLKLATTLLDLLKERGVTLPLSHQVTHRPIVPLFHALLSKQDIRSLLEAANVAPLSQAGD